ncbi:hypothetical protein PFISCL1PPCAC_1576, partial [Pristionchus fissidentatus]
LTTCLPTTVASNRITTETTSTRQESTVLTMEDTSRPMELPTTARVTATTTSTDRSTAPTDTRTALPTTDPAASTVTTTRSTTRGTRTDTVSGGGVRCTECEFGGRLLSICRRRRRQEVLVLRERLWTRRKVLQRILRI